MADDYAGFLKQEINKEKEIQSDFGSRIEASKAREATLSTSLTTYMEYLKSHSPVGDDASSDTPQNPPNEDEEEGDDGMQRGLPSEGRARETFELLNAYYDTGLNRTDIISMTGRNPRSIDVVITRGKKDGRIEKRGDKLFMTAKAKEQLAKSVPYTGTLKIPAPIKAANRYKIVTAAQTFHGGAAATETPKPEGGKAYAASIV